MVGKRPAACVKVELSSPAPKKRKKEKESEKAETPEKPEKVETPKKPEKAEKKTTKEKPEKVESKEKSEDKNKASDGKVVKPAKALKQGQLPAPGKEVWKDVHTQVMKLARDGKPALRNAWEKASQAGGQQAKREFYYNVFLLDPAVSHKAVHKESLERLQEKETVTKGWMTAYQIGVLQGADPADPDFKELCLAACEGLKERPHEVEKWAAKGVKQYYAEKELNTEQTKVKESTTKASQHVEDLENDDFQHVEEALSVKPEKKQVLLGGKKSVKALDQPEKADEEEETDEQKYTAALKAAKKALGSLGSAVDKSSFLLKQMQAKKPEMASNAQLQSSIGQLEELESKNLELKNARLAELSSFKNELEKPEMAEKLLEALAGLKKACEDGTKAVQKDMAPHKLWAKNAGIQ